MTRRLVRPSGRAAAAGAALAAALLIGGGVVLVGDPSPDEATGPATVTPSEAAPRAPAPASPAAVPAGEMRVRPAVPLDAAAHFDRALSLRVTEVEAVRGVARGPGEIAGPAVRLTVRLTNRGGRPVSLESVVLAVSYGRDETPAVTLSGPGGRPFGGELGPGRSQSARYVFAIPVAARGDVRVVASYTGAAPAVQLVGSAS